MDFKNNEFLFNERLKLNNLNGLYSGVAGSGKSNAVKEEISHILNNTSDNVIVLDGYGEYKELCDSFKGEYIRLLPFESDYYINPLEINKHLLDTEEYSHLIVNQTEFVLSVLEIIKGELTSMEKALIYKCMQIIYENNPNPTFEDLYNELEQVKGSECPHCSEPKKDLLDIIGHINNQNILTHKSNFDTNNRLIVLDISDFSKETKTIAGLISLEYAWKKMCENMKSQKYTWLYIEEMNDLVFNEYFIYTYKKCRLYGGVITFVTQDIEAILKNQRTRLILGNSEFLRFFKLPPYINDELAKFLNVNPDVFKNNDYRHSVAVVKNEIFHVKTVSSMNFSNLYEHKVAR